jgi:hypothetical protein
MIVAHGLSEDGHLTILLGLTRRNCEELLKGHPIKKGEETTRVPMTIIIVGGETEEAIAKELGDAGMLDQAEIFDDKAAYEIEMAKKGEGN